MEPLAVSITLRASLVNASAWPTLSAFCLVTAAISSREAEVSSMAAA